MATFARAETLIACHLLKAVEGWTATGVLSMPHAVSISTNLPQPRKLTPQIALDYGLEL
jgi:hypothetical protein